jgi:hypothetical protein
MVRICNLLAEYWRASLANLRKFCDSDSDRYAAISGEINRTHLFYAAALCRNVVTE